MIIGTAKETYRADEALLTTRPQQVWMAVLLAGLAVLPFTFNAYWTYLACLVLINVIAATGLNVLTGFTGLVSLGHAAFMAIGAYTVAWLERDIGTPLLLNLLAGGLLAAGIGVIVGLPSLRVKGLYLAIATIAASFILHFVFVEWTAVTGGSAGISLQPGTVFGVALVDYTQLYWLIMPICVLMVTGAANLFRNRIGRAFIAIRDRDISAEVLGIPILRYKLMSFALASFYAGVAGGLWAYFFRVVTPESFPLLTSIFLLAAVIVGGMGTILGGVIGALFMTLVPELLRFGVELLGPVIPNAGLILSPVRTIVFGALIVGFLVFEPQGLTEIVQRIRRFFRLWPFRT
ncbi:branched-chain amino acid ABC transporter permease [Paenirhodobacter sp. CAU 1674]|jgi:branched-chain amino acid transport system permease protein|uniref:branched-chain amino acid ABC transporter permease n=1 Tax=Paenirhodobacter sp. CAU 1674 TaxID=3032596 RepID=UPI0023DB3EC1|nr:branched-chain amino acid ABC transporter permease [Paenirhodobacter sp. CAU 1674]MDF2142876.1 branched-chain amino acid ABC transporter permease [Paenirhodobacter sp. CAU 1674]